jgi:hypothetical protein
MDAGMGNFKGVMLCNRPAVPSGFQSSRGGAGDGGGEPTMVNKPAFVSSVVPQEQLGVNVPRKGFGPRRTKPRGDDVTWRHKKWLAEFRERRNELVDMMEEKTVELEEKKKAFSEKQARMRAAIRMARDIDGGDPQLMGAALTGRVKVTQQQLDQYEAQLQPSQPQTQPQQLPHGVYEMPPQQAQMQPPQQEVVEPVRLLVRKRRKNAASKPRWAMTEEENEEFEEGEVDDLLNFASNLDYDAYIGDMEEKEAALFVQKQASELNVDDGEDVIVEEGDGDFDEYEEYEADDPNNVEGPKVLRHRLLRRVRRRRQPESALVDARPAWDSSSNIDTMSQFGAGGSAREVLGSHRGLQGVHSAASVRAMMQRVQPVGDHQLSTTRGALSVLPGTQAMPQLPLPNPTVTISQPKSFTTERRDPDPSNLPFLYRHPGI